jgi:pimeloyl-ACP methyl ester carboxylesterase
MHTTEIAGYPALVTDGDAARPRLLFLHGAFASHQCFTRWLSVFERRGWRCIAPSLRGRLGVPPPKAEGVTLWQYLDDARRILDALAEKPAIIGHSIGGLLAQKLAEEDRCAAAVLLAPAPPWNLAPQADTIPALMPMLPGIMLDHPVRPPYWSAVRIILNRMPQPDRRRVYDSLLYESGICFREALAGSVRVDREKVRVPIRIIAASDDRVISPALARVIADYYRADFSVLDAHGHWFIEEPGWEPIAEGVADWLERALPRSDHS